MSSQLAPKVSNREFGGSVKVAQRQNPDRNRVLWGGILAGLGLGGFFDGIVLHQILQWHHMVSNVYPVTTVAGLRVNTLGDGLFHAATYVFVVTGLLLLWSVGRRSHVVWPAGLLIGALLTGWGLFNVVEGVVDHHILQVHHVRGGPNQLAYDLAFLSWGAAMLVGGWVLVRRGLSQVSAEKDKTIPPTDRSKH